MLLLHPLWISRDNPEVTGSKVVTMSRSDNPSVTPLKAAQDSHLDLWPSACSKMANMVNPLRLHQWEFLCLQSTWFAPLERRHLFYDGPEGFFPVSYAPRGRNALRRPRRQTQPPTPPLVAAGANAYDNPPKLSPQGFWEQCGGTPCSFGNFLSETTFGARARGRHPAVLSANSEGAASIH
jgi:hypothetical protein